MERVEEAELILRTLIEFDTGGGFDDGAFWGAYYEYYAARHALQDIRDAVEACASGTSGQ